MNMNVILADDHNMIRSALRMVLDSEDDISVVGEASNGRDAVQLVRRLEPDVAIMDVAMPDLNGIDATKQILLTGLQTKILALSMHSDADYVRRMVKAGAMGYLLKSGAIEELAAAVRIVAAGQTYLDTQVMDTVLNDYCRLDDEQPESAAILSGREREILQLIAEGWSTGDIAERIYVSVKTVATHRQNIMDKLQLRSIPELTRYAIREGITTLA